MARPLRVQFPGAIYHVTMRGVERRVIFGDHADRERFLDRLGEAVENYGARLYLFCLMPNHVHLLLETPRANLSAFMHALQTAYTVYFNRRHQRAGHLMQGRFWAKPVAGDAYLLKLSRYLHLNPVSVATARDQPLGHRRAELRAYPWSSYRGYAGLAMSKDYVSERPILAMTGKPGMNRRRAYRRFVESGLTETNDEFLEVLKGSVWGIGGQEFQDRIRDVHADMARQANRPEDMSFRHAGRTVCPATIVSVVADAFGMQAVDLRRRRRHERVARGMAAAMLVRYAGLNQREVGRWLGMTTGSAVSHQLRRLRERLECDAILVRRMNKIIAIIERGREHADVR